MQVAPPSSVVTAFPLVLLGLLVLCSLWVLFDARSRATRGRRVTATLGTWQIEEPESWALLNLLVWVIFFPLYLRARSES